jgi:hypothetical protein
MKEEPIEMTQAELTEWTGEQFGGFFTGHRWVWRKDSGFSWLMEVWSREWRESPTVIVVGSMRIQVDYLFGDPELKVIVNLDPMGWDPVDHERIYEPFLFILSRPARDVLELMEGWGAVD